VGEEQLIKNGKEHGKMQELKLFQGAATVYELHWFVLCGAALTQCSSTQRGTPVAFEIKIHRVPAYAGVPCVMPCVMPCRAVPCCVLPQAHCQAADMHWRHRPVS